MNQDYDIGAVLNQGFWDSALSTWHQLALSMHDVIRCYDARPTRRLTRREKKKVRRQRQWIRRNMVHNAGLGRCASVLCSNFEQVIQEYRDYSKTRPGASVPRSLRALVGKDYIGSRGPFVARLSVPKAARPKTQLPETSPEEFAAFMKAIDEMSEHGSP